MSTIPYLSLVVALVALSPTSTPWRWFLALSGTERWRLLDGPATLVIAGDSVRAQLRDAADTTRVRLSFEGPFEATAPTCWSSWQTLTRSLFPRGGSCNGSVLMAMAGSSGFWLPKGQRSA